MQNYRANGNAGMRRMNYGYNNGCKNSCMRTDYRNHNGCCEREDRLEGMPIAMAYVPWQSWKRIYEAGEGFHRGTIFEELDLPFCGKGGCNS